MALLASLDHHDLSVYEILFRYDDEICIEFTFSSLQNENLIVDQVSLRDLTIGIFYIFSVYYQRRKSVV